MSIHKESNLAGWRSRLLSTLNRVRTAPDHDAVNADFYIALGLISAAYSLGAICINGSERLHDLAMNATQHRTAELFDLAKARRSAIAQEAAA